MDIDTHPNPQPNPHHRKIDLQSPHDLTYLQNNLAESALQKLDLHFPKLSKPATHIALGHSNTTTSSDTKEENKDEDNEDEEDPMRRRVRELVSEFLTTTWQSASHSISVNGIDASTIPISHTATLSPAPLPASNGDSSSARAPLSLKETEGVDFQYAPFDASLQHKLASLHGELEALTAQVSKLRRTAPSQAAERYQTRLKTALDADDARHESQMQDLKNEEVQGLDIDEMREGWQEDVKEVYERGIEELAGLAGAGQSINTEGGGMSTFNRGPTLTETVGKAQRARTVTMEME